MKKLLFLFVLLAVFSLALPASAKNTAPIPPILDIRSPGSDVPTSLVAFSGTWEGKWSGSPSLDHVLIVEKMTANAAEVVYSIGALDSSPPRFWRSNATLSEKNRLLKMVWPQGIGKSPITVMYQLKSDNEMAGTWDNGQGASSVATMKKVQ